MERPNEAYNGDQDIGVLEEIEKSLLLKKLALWILRSLRQWCFFSFLMTFKNSDGLYFSFSTYDGRRSALMHMIKFDEKNCISFKEMDEPKNDYWAAQVNYSTNKRFGLLFFEQLKLHCVAHTKFFPPTYQSIHVLPTKTIMKSPSKRRRRHRTPLFIPHHTNDSQHYSQNDHLQSCPTTNRYHILANQFHHHRSNRHSQRFQHHLYPRLAQKSPI